MNTTPLSDIESTSSPVVDSAAASSSSQPTYTTAGTIYKPSSSQPLQPPTRRGRLPKWSAGGIHSDLSLFPKSVLAGLSMKAPGGRPNSALQQYTPLQQNNHRAVSPFSDPDHLVAKMPAEVLRLRPGNTTTAFSVTVLSEEGSQDKAATEDGEHRSPDGSDDESEDSDAKITLLMNMPVKSLHNLASYQNPSQKYAQRALQRGTRSRPLALGSSSMGSAKSTSPPTLSAYNPPSCSNEIGGPSNLGHQGLPDIFGFRRVQLDASPRVDDTWDTRNGTSTPTFPNHPRTNSTVIEVPASVANSTSTNGTLLPLTAGPPGQRQYRPLAVESISRALASVGPSSSPTSNISDDDTIQIANRVLFEAGIEDVRIESIGSLFAENLNNTSSSNQTWDEGDGDTEPLRLAPPTVAVNGDQMQGQLHDLADSSERMRVWDPNERLIQTKTWRDPSPEVRALYKPGTDRLTDSALAARNNKVERWWFSGVNSRHLTIMPEDIPLPQSLPETDHDFGVIGDRRLKTPINPSENASVEETMEEAKEEAKVISTSENAESPLETHNILEANMKKALQQIL